MNHKKPCSVLVYFAKPHHFHQTLNLSQNGECDLDLCSFSFLTFFFQFSLVFSFNSQSLFFNGFPPSHYCMSFPMLHTQHTQPPIHTSSPLLSLPYEVLLDIIQTVATATPSLCPHDLLNLSATCSHLHSIIQTQSSIWKFAFSTKYDTGAIHRRRLHTYYHWQANMKRRYRALRHCALGVQACTATGKVAWLNHVDWQSLWDMISEHGIVAFFYFIIN
jgi:hypothetical protein